MGAGEIIVAVLAGALGGFTFLSATDFALKEAAWCVTGEQHCLREWIAALSGWAAAVAAGVTILVLLGQLREARRQTEFIVGDAPPTVSVSDPLHTGASEAFQNRIIVTNWNRNPVVLHRVTIDDEWGQELVEARVVENDTIRQNIRQAQFEQERLFIEGWTDRNVAPPQVTIFVVVGNRARTDDSFAVREYARICVDLTVLEPEPNSRRIVISSPYTLVI